MVVTQINGCVRLSGGTGGIITMCTCSGVTRPSLPGPWSHFQSVGPETLLRSGNQAGDHASLLSCGPQSLITRPWFLLIIWDGQCPCWLPLWLAPGEVGSLNHFCSSAGQAFFSAAALTLPVVVITAPTLLLLSKRCHLASYFETLSIISMAVRVPSSVTAASPLRS